MAFSVEYLYQIIDKYSAPLDRISEKTQKFQKIAGRTSAGINKMSKRLGKFGDKAANLQTVVGGAALTASMVLFVKSASALDDKMADVQRSTGLIGDKLLAMRDKIVAVSIASGKGALGLSDIVYQGGKLGIANVEMGGFLTTVTKTANAFDVLEGTAAEDIGKIRDNLGLSMKSTENFMSQINYLADNVSANGANMIEIIKRTSGTMKNLNVPTEVIAGWAAFADQITVSPQLAASGLNMMMARMMTMPGMMQKMLDDPKKAALGMLKDLSKLSDVKRAKRVFKIFGQEAGRFVLSATSKINLLDKAFELAGSKKALKSMNAEWAIYLQRTSTKGKQILEIFKAIGRTIGKHFIKTFDKMSSGLMTAGNAMLRFTKSHPVLVKTTLAILALVAGSMALIVPLGIIAASAAAILPVFSALAGFVGAVSAPMLILVGVGLYLSAIFVGMYAKSMSFRMAISNLTEAFYPLIRVAKKFAGFVGSVLGGELDKSGKDLKNWGDVFANVLNFIAAMVSTLTLGFERLIGITGKVISGDLKEAWALAKAPLPEIQAMSGTQSKKQQIELTGQIGVTGQNGAVVESAKIGLPTGANLAMAQ